MSNRPRRQPVPAARSRVSRRSHGAPSGRSPNWLVAVLVGAIPLAILAAILVAAFRSGDDGPSGSARINGAILPDLPDNGVDPAVGVKAPVFQATGRDGATHTVGSGGGPTDPAKALLFVSTDCTPCIDAVRAAVAAVEAAPDGAAIEVIVGGVDADAAATWLSDTGWTGPVWADPSTGITDAFGVETTPAWVVHDRYNVVTARRPGEVPPDLAALLAAAVAAA